MAKLKEKVLLALQNGKQLEVTLDDISKSQENLLKNHSNPVFNKTDKNKIMKEYTDLQNLGKSLYRYNTLQEHNYLTDAQEEQKNIETKVLKGGISYYKYIWHAENSKNTCDKCRELDGQVFDFYDEVPERPHPNCKCWVEVVENDDVETEPDEQKHPQEDNSSKNEEQKNWIKPCNGPITSLYGWRIHPVYKTKKFHNGWDIGVLSGTPVRAVADGKVYYVGRADGYGKMVILDHGKINGITVTSEYGHIQSWNVSKGQFVKTGQVIAKSGNEGTSSGPHLHLTIREGVYRGQAEDPGKYIKF